MDHKSRKLECPPRIAIEMGYPWEQRKGQRHFGPPHDWIANPPKGTEVFVGKIPRDSDENELIPLFSQAGTIYTMRIMMDFSGFNRGFAFVRFTRKSEAQKAVKMFNGYPLRGERRIGVSLSVDNSRLFVGGLPKMAKKDDILKEFRKIVKGIVNVIMYPNPKDVNLNRGFAFLEFDSHHSAAAARRDLIPCPETAFGKLLVDWAEPEPDIDEKIMEKVKILYVRNLTLNTTEATLANLFNCVIRPEKVQRVKKINDYAFIHFATRSDAEKAMELLSDCTVDGAVIEIQWARPVEDRSLYKLKKLINKGLVDESILYTSNESCRYGINNDIKNSYNVFNANDNRHHSSTVCDTIDYYNNETASPHNIYNVKRNIRSSYNSYDATHDNSYSRTKDLHKMNARNDFNRQPTANNYIKSSDMSYSVDNGTVFYGTDSSTTHNDVCCSNMPLNSMKYKGISEEIDYNDDFKIGPTGQCYSKPLQITVPVLDSKYFLQNVSCGDFVKNLLNICEYYKWLEPKYELRHTVHGYYYMHHCLVTLCIGAPFNASPMYVGPFISVYSHTTEYEAKNDAARCAVEYIDTICNVFSGKAVNIQDTSL